MKFSEEVKNTLWNLIQERILQERKNGIFQH